MQPFAGGKRRRPDENVGEPEGALLEELDDLELIAAPRNAVTAGDVIREASEKASLGNSTYKTQQGTAPTSDVSALPIQ